MGNASPTTERQLRLGWNTAAVSQHRAMVHNTVRWEIEQDQTKDTVGFREAECNDGIWPGNWGYYPCTHKKVPGDL